MSLKIILIYRFKESKEGVQKLVTIAMSCRFKLATRVRRDYRQRLVIFTSFWNLEKNVFFANTLTY